MNRWKILAAVGALALPAPAPAAAQSFDACYVPSVGALYMIKRTGLPGACLGAAHVEVNWTAGSGGTVSSVTAGTGLTGGTITSTGTLAVDFGGTGAAETAARSDHTHATAGSSNTAVGFNAQLANTGGTRNTAFGAGALRDNTTNDNTGIGAGALNLTTTGIQNTAVGSSAMQNNTTGFANIAIGQGAMLTNVSGSRNTAIGRQVMENNVAGSRNVAVGDLALELNTGSDNIAVGWLAGSAATSGNGNIYIGHVGVAAEGSTIRLGTVGSQTRAFLAGVSGATAASGVAVFVNAQGQLGTVTSSRRFKTDVADIGARSAAVLDLRPVAFRYRPEYDDGANLVQYGLIAEEVAEVMPELVVYGADGRVETVRYHLLVPLLLAELQRQAREIAELRARLP